MSERKNKFDQKQLFSHLAKDLHELVSNKQSLRSAAETFLNNVIDELTIGIIFDLHRKYKTNAFALDLDETSEDVETGDFDILSHNTKKNQDCVCPNCDRAVAATRFAQHLQTCMGMGRMSSRNASRRAVCNSKDNATYGGLPSDDDDDVDWGSAVEQRKKKKDKNGSKRNRGTPKKNYESTETVDSLNIDIEGEDEELTNLRDILRLQDHSNSTSPADSASSSGSTKKKEKTKIKKSSKRERRSPSPNSALE